MNIIKKFEDKKVRVSTINGEPFFSAKDICDALAIINPSQAVSDLDKDDVLKVDAIDSIGRTQKSNYINEGALYQLIFKSKVKNAKRFQKWITHEVIPEIRKTGKYSLPEKLKKDSTKSRNLLTSEWKKHGIKKPNEYIKLTLQEYRALDIEDGKRKKDFDYYDMLRLNALESMESLKLFSSEISGVDECCDSLENTAGAIKQIQESN